MPCSYEEEHTSGNIPLLKTIRLYVLVYARAADQRRDEVYLQTCLSASTITYNLSACILRDLVNVAKGSKSRSERLQSRVKEVRVVGSFEVVWTITYRQ